MKLSNLSLINIISWLQIIGGISGLGLIAYLLLQTDTINGPVLLIFLIGISLFVFSLYTGNSLFFDKNKKKGIILTIINQSLQLLQWNVLGYGISYSSGAELLIGIRGVAMNFKIAAFVSTFSMSIHSKDAFFINVNLASILIIVLSVKYFNNIKRREILY
ncbi:MAG: hypothetical protein ACOH2A_05585 [Sphingobacteriaceae bacterium]